MRQARDSKQELEAALKQSSQSDAPEPSSGKLGVDIAVLWRGDMLTARFFSRPELVTIGPDGTFTMPEDVVGKPLAILVEPHPTAEFGLRIDHDKAHGHLILGGEVHDLDDVRAGKVSGVQGPVVALTAGTRAVQVYGDFTFIVSRVPVPPPARFSLWNREMLPFLLCFIAALSLVGGPLVAAFSTVGFRSKAEILKRMEDARRTIEIEIVEEQKPPEEEKEPEQKQQEPPKLEPQPESPAEKEDKEDKKAEELAKAIDEKLDKLSEEDRKAEVTRLVDEKAKATDAIDEAMNSAELPGTKLFAESEGDEGDTANPQGQAGPTVLADPDGQGSKLMGGGGPKTQVGSSESTQKKVAHADLEKDTAAGKDVKMDVKERKQDVIKLQGKVSNVSGELPAKVIQDYIRRKMGAIKACYQKGLQANPELEGSITVKFLIQPTGSIGAAKVENSSIGNSSVEECVLTNVKAWRFPQASTGASTTVVYPFRFSSK